MPWIAIRKPPRRRAGPVHRWREAHRDQFLAWSAGAMGVAILLGVWFVAARAVAG